MEYCKSIKICVQAHSDTALRAKDHFLLVRALACWFHPSLGKNYVMGLRDSAAPLMPSLLFSPAS